MHDCADHPNKRCKNKSMMKVNIAKASANLRIAHMALKCIGIAYIEFHFDVAYFGQFQ